MPSESVEEGWKRRLRETKDRICHPLGLTQQQAAALKSEIKVLEQIIRERANR
jgi:hypothetical protein